MLELLKLLLTQWAGEEVKDKLDERMTKHIPKIVAGMESKGMTVANNSVDTVVRDALFRLIRSVVPSGDVSDFIRDRIEDKIKPVVRTQLTVASDLRELVTLTKDALLEQLF